MAAKHCPVCNSTNVTRFGKARRKQRYRCKDCGKSWSNIARRNRTISAVWQDFVFKHLSVSILAKKYHKTNRTIHNYLDSYLPPRIVHHPRPVVIVADTTYFGRTDGKLVVLDPHGEDRSLLYFCNLHTTEKTIDYATAISELIDRGYHIIGAVIDGRRGVRQMMERRGILVQHCQFHQLLTVTQCLTKHPKLPQNIELKNIASSLTKTTEPVLRAQLEAWHKEHGDWLKESHIDPETSRRRYTHDRTRRAYFSLKRNLPYLFTYQNELFNFCGIQLPNTTNALDGRFGAYKRVVKSNPRCSKRLKTKIFFSLLSGGTD
jgi:Transposase and inactivated derivatives